MIVVLMGVSGSGKTTVGVELARQLGWDFVDADAFHPAANVAKMHRGEALDDADRLPWLHALRAWIESAVQADENLVLACSALKHDYREYLRHDLEAFCRYVYLRGDEELIRQRLEQRRGHFMPPGLLHSQFEALEPPHHAIVVDIAEPPNDIATAIRRALTL